MRKYTVRYKIWSIGSTGVQALYVAFAATTEHWLKQPFVYQYLHFYLEIWT